MFSCGSFFRLESPHHVTLRVWRLQAAAAGLLASPGWVRYDVNFHAVRHTVITEVYRATHDLYLTQRFARRSSPLTTTIYTHPSDEELCAARRGIKT
jgi:integrase